MARLGRRFGPHAQLGFRIGLFGPDRDTGLGYQNAAIAQHLGVTSWLVTRRLFRHELRLLPPWTRRVPVSRRDSSRRLTRSISDLDCLVFAEQPGVPEVIRIAKRQGIKVVCVPNWEHLAPELCWMRWVDLMICPTRATAALLLDWRARYQFSFDVVMIPWPIDINRHRFQKRSRCRSYLYINGWGGCRARRLDGTLTSYHRKGLDAVISAAALCPEINFVIHSQVRIKRQVPANVEIRGRQRDNCSLYDDGDVCLQPSAWEGIGLPLLECQAAGLPLVTTDAPPMNEYHPLATLPVAGKEIVRLTPQPFLASILDPGDIAEVLRRIHGQSVSEASVGARAYVEAEHSWSRRGPEILAVIERSLGTSRIAPPTLE